MIENTLFKGPDARMVVCHMSQIPQIVRLDDDDGHDCSTCIHSTILRAPNTRTPERTPANSTRKSNSMSSSTVLYSFWRSSCAWRVRTALEWKGVAYEIKSVNLQQRGGEQFQEAFTKLNPNQRVPTLVIDGHVLSQSSAILEYLEETRPEKPLLPKDSYQRARVRNICAIICADIQPLQSISVTAKAVETVSEDEKVAKQAEWVRHWIDRGFVGLEQELLMTAGKYCVGDDVTLADVYLLPQVFNAKVVNVDMSKFPTIARIAADLEKVPAFDKAHPLKQVGAPTEL